MIEALPMVVQKSNTVSEQKLPFQPFQHQGVQPAHHGCYKRASAHFVSLQDNLCIGLVQALGVLHSWQQQTSQSCSAPTTKLRRLVSDRGVQSNLGGFALVQQAQPAQLYVRVVTQRFTEGSIGQVSNVGSLPHNLLQAFCQSHGALEGLRDQLEVVL